MKGGDCVRKEEMVCDECGKDMDYAGESCENTDADGNRGQMMLSFTCECGYEMDCLTGERCGRQF